MSAPPAILSQLKCVKPCANGWSACCPAHDDRNASLSICLGDDGRLLLKCHAGCPNESIVAALGLTMADLFAAQPSGPKRRIVATYD